MKQVAKIIIIDNDDKYLLLIRNHHPVFGNDPDIPGGTIELGESPEFAMIREVYEEAGIQIDNSKIELKYEGIGYSTEGNHYSLYIVKLDRQPKITLSQEHSKYEWLNKKNFLEIIKNAKDSYMHMVYEKLKNY